MIIFGRLKTNEQFLIELHEINPNIKALNKYAGASTKIEFECLIDGCKWMAKPNTILSGEGCPKCGLKKISNLKRKKHDDFIQELHNVNPNVKVLGQYTRSSDPIECQCLIDGHIWSARPNDLLKGQNCPICGQKQRAQSKTYTHEYFIQKMNERHPDIDIIGKYHKMNEYINCRCKKCGHEWNAIANNLFNNHVGCPVCNASKGERFIMTFLQQSNILFEQQYCFNDCVDKKPLPFDFALFDNKRLIGLIEYDGEQHYKPLNFFGGDEQFRIRQLHDQIKTQYCIANNISLLRCNYLCSYEQIQTDIINFINTIYN